MEVDEEHRGPTPVVGHQGAGGVAQEHVRQHHHHHNDQARRREDAPNPACVETEDGGPAGRLPFTQQDSRNHETRDDEEHVHADVSAGETGDSCVEEDDEQDGDCTKTFDIGTEATVAGSGAGLATRREEPGVDSSLSLN